MFEERPVSCKRLSSALSRVWWGEAIQTGGNSDDRRGAGLGMGCRVIAKPSDVRAMLDKGMWQGR